MEGFVHAEVYQNSPPAHSVTKKPFAWAENTREYCTSTTVQQTTVVLQTIAFALDPFDHFCL